MDYKNMQEVKEIDKVINYIVGYRKKLVEEWRAKEKEVLEAQGKPQQGQKQEEPLIVEYINKLCIGICDMEKTLFDELKEKLKEL